MSTTQVQKPETERLQDWRFGCYAHGLIYSPHTVRAASAEEADAIHDRMFPEHQFANAFLIEPKKHRKRIHKCERQRPRGG